MRRDVLELRQFYASPMGKIARQMVARKLSQAWGDGNGLDMLGLGYATPFLDSFRGKARRTVAAMPAAQGVELWPNPLGAPDAENDAQARPMRGLSCLADELALPHPNALFDRILAVHAELGEEQVGLAGGELDVLLARRGRLRRAHLGLVGAGALFAAATGLVEHAGPASAGRGHGAGNQPAGRLSPAPRAQTPGASPALLGGVTPRCR